MEREYSIEQAEHYFALECQKLQLSVELKKFGEPPFQTVACSLFRNPKEKVSEGGGKGIGKQSELSAKFEALEVFTGLASQVSALYDLFSLSEIRLLQIPVIASKIFPELLSVDFPQQEKKLPWIAYTRYDSNEKCYLPAICSHPFYYRKPFADDDFDYSNLYLTATTNGIATGCTRTEALIHALLEVIERHSLSIFLIETFLKENPKDPKKFDIQTLPKELKEIAENIITTTGYDLIIYHMPNEIDIPVYGVLLHHPTLAIPIKGCGASLNPSYAIERALLEALEVYHYDPSNIEDQRSIERLTQWPKLQRCAEFDLSCFKKNSPFEHTAVTFNSSQEYLAHIVSQLQSAHFSIYFNETYVSEHLSTVHVVIPEAEDFFAVGMGLVVPLQKKGMEALCPS